MYKPYTLREARTDDYAEYLLSQSQSKHPIIVLGGTLKKGKKDILSLEAINIFEKERQIRFATNRTHRNFVRSRFDEFKATFLHDSTGTYKIIGVREFRDHDLFHATIKFITEKVEDDSIMSQAYAEYLALLAAKETNA